VRELTEIRREHRQELRRKKRQDERRHLREHEEAEVYKIRFRGDFSTPYGLAAATDGITRLYAEGRISQRRCETLLKSMRIMIMARILGSARPLLSPASSRPPAGQGELIQADTRPYELRRAELKTLRNRIMRIPDLSPEAESPPEAPRITDETSKPSTRVRSNSKSSNKMKPTKMKPSRKIKPDPARAGTS
jgi:hypothetical protein